MSIKFNRSEKYPPPKDERLFVGVFYIDGATCIEICSWEKHHREPYGR
jgi:hypothetical protein